MNGAEGVATEVVCLVVGIYLLSLLVVVEVAAEVG